MTKEEIELHLKELDILTKELEKPKEDEEFNQAVRDANNEGSYHELNDKLSKIIRQNEETTDKLSVVIQLLTHKQT